MKELRKHRESGFTLIEALIALLIVMIGLLGVAGMQALAIHNSTQAHIRTLASLDAHSLASVMRANRAYWTDVAAAPATVSIAASGGSVSISPASLAAGPDCSAATCTAAQSAAYALNQWAQSLLDLPSATKATITRAAVTGSAPSAYLVTLQWSEQNLEAKNQGVTKSTTTTPTTSVVVQP